MTSIAADRDRLAQSAVPGQQPPPERRLTSLVTFRAMWAREFRVMRRMGVTVILRVILQPLLTVFVFSFVLPQLTGSRLNPHGPSLTTVLVPGMVATATMMTGMMSVIFPLMMEMGWANEIADRLLAPLPVWGIGLQKIFAGQLQSLMAGLAVFPVVLLVHARGNAPEVHVTNWPMLIALLLITSLLAPSIGLFLGTVGDPAKTNQLFTFILMPASMLGCVYYPWQALQSMRWLQYTVLLNPVVYASEGMRSVLTPSVPHMSAWVFLPVLAGGAAVMGVLGCRSFARRVLS